MVLGHVLRPAYHQRLEQALASRRAAASPSVNMSSSKNTKLRPIHVCMDFDGTLTKKDTMAALAGVCYKEQARLGNHDFPPWSHFVGAYTRDYREHESEYRPKKEDRRTVEKEIDWLNSLEKIEKASLQRVKDSGLFDLKLLECGDGNDGKPLFTEPLRSGEVQMRPGYIDIVSDILGLNSDYDSSGIWDNRTEVVSVNWSRTWVVQCLFQAAQQDCEDEPMAPLVFAYVSYCAGESTNDRALSEPQPNDIPLAFSGLVRFANLYIATEAEVLSGGCSDRFANASLTGRAALYKPRQVQGLHCTCRRKQNSLSIACHSLILRQYYNNGDPTGAQGLRIFVGDSITDLECLLGAHLGICIHNEMMRSGQRDLAETLQRIGIITKSLSSFGDNDRSLLQRRLARQWPPIQRLPDRTFKLNFDHQPPPILYTARDFTEINEWRKKWHERIPFNVGPD